MSALRRLSAHRRPPLWISDVIDWILDNLIDKNRTRRGVIKKLKELGLIFKAPTRKSVAAGVSKHLWHYDQDTRLRELYDEHRLDDGKFDIALHLCGVPLVRLLLCAITFTSRRLDNMSTRLAVIVSSIFCLWRWFCKFWRVSAIYFFFQTAFTFPTHGTDCLEKIMEEFVDTRSRNAVVKRMVEIGLIAERSEILPSKRKKSSGKSQPANRSDDESGSDGDGDSDDSDATDTRTVKVTVKNVRSKATAKAKPAKPDATRKPAKPSLDVAKLRRIAAELDASVKEHLEWVQESLNDAAEDAEDVDDDEDTNDGKIAHILECSRTCVCGSNLCSFVSRSHS